MLSWWRHYSGLHMCQHLQAPARMVAEDDMLRAIVDVGPRLASAPRELWQRLVPVCTCRALCSHMPHLQATTASAYAFVHLLIINCIAPKQ